LEDLYKAHKGALKINKFVEMRTLEKSTFIMKEDESDPKLRDESETSKVVMTMNWLDKEDKKALGCIETREGKKFYVMQFDGEIIGRTKLAWYNHLVNPKARSKEID
jgi:hypothetical protein